MQTVALSVHDVVNEIDGRGCGGKGREGHQCVTETVGPAQGGTSQWRGEYQQVFRPLPGPGCLDSGDDKAG
jgi:hypothetical protein